MDPGLNSLLKWGIQNSEDAGSNTANNNDTSRTSANGLNEEALRSLLGGPSDAQLMKEAMTVIQNPEATLEAKLTAFDNFEQLIEGIDNANNMEPLGLWTPLIQQLENTEADLRRMAAWCIGTAVQNNSKSQERFLAVNGIPKLCSIATEDANANVRRKAVYALSSEVRNYQPAMNEAVKHLPKDLVGDASISAEDMEAIDVIMNKLRERS